MTTITRHEAEERLEGVLKALGIKAYVPCTEFDAELEFPDGAKYEGHLYIDCDGISHQRG
jgi:hypothetical protein